MSQSAGDTVATVQLRSAVRARKDLITHRVGPANQLRAHLEFFHPARSGSSLTSAASPACGS